MLQWGLVSVLAGSTGAGLVLGARVALGPVFGGPAEQAASASTAVTAAMPREGLTKAR
jgi:hypothetical protein